MIWLWIMEKPCDTVCQTLFGGLFAKKVRADHEETCGSLTYVNKLIIRHGARHLSQV